MTPILRRRGARRMLFAACVAALGALFLYSHTVRAEEEMPAMTPPAEEAAAPVDAAPAPLPNYFSSTNADPEKPTWPDTTGGAADVWATPAGDGKGDTPATVGSSGVYDRVAPNPCSI